jgi:hypothetical protein
MGTGGARSLLLSTRRPMVALSCSMHHASRVERWVRARPEQWLWLHRHWLKSQL